MSETQDLPSSIKDVLKHLASVKLSPAALIISLLDHHPADPATLELLEASELICDTFLHHTGSSERVRSWCSEHMKEIYATEVSTVANINAGLHFVAAQASQESLEGMEMEFLARTFRTKAPYLWNLMGLLMRADVERNRQQRWREKRRTGTKRKRSASTSSTRSDSSEINRDKAAPVAGDDAPDEEPITLPPKCRERYIPE